MRLLNTSTLDLKQFTTSWVPEYVILSHTWCDQEITFGDFRTGSILNGPSAASIADKKPASLAKVKGTCWQASRDEYDWVWIDSCCIDKSSSSELQEAINSMWRWYCDANICYVYLADVASGANSDDAYSFRTSRWFTRGWTLQELIAPSTVEFFAMDWSSLGTKLERIDELSRITGISKSVLRDGNVRNNNAAEKMSWAAHRQVTKAEDMAYCLIGLFDINMPMLYGEGGTKAFLRLQEEIFKRNPDHTLFLFTYCNSPNFTNFLADEPSRFCQSESCKICPSNIILCFPKHIKFESLRFLRPRDYIDGFSGQTLHNDLTVTQNGVFAALWILDDKEVIDQHVAFPFSNCRPSLGCHAVAILNVTYGFGTRESRGLLGLWIKDAFLKENTFIRMSFPPVHFCTGSSGDTTPHFSSSIPQKTVFVMNSAPKVIPETEVWFALQSDIYSISSWRIDGFVLGCKAKIHQDKNFVLSTPWSQWKFSLIVQSASRDGQTYPSLLIQVMAARTEGAKHCTIRVTEIRELDWASISVDYGIKSPLCERSTSRLCDGTTVSARIRQVPAFRGLLNSDNSNRMLYLRYQIHVQLD